MSAEIERALTRNAELEAALRRWIGEDELERDEYELLVHQTLALLKVGVPLPQNLGEPK